MEESAQPRPGMSPKEAMYYGHHGTSMLQVSTVVLAAPLGVLVNRLMLATVYARPDGSKPSWRAIVPAATGFFMSTLLLLCGWIVFAGPWPGTDDKAVGGGGLNGETGRPPLSPQAFVLVWVSVVVFPHVLAAILYGSMASRPADWSPLARYVHEMGVLVAPILVCLTFADIAELVLLAQLATVLGLAFVGRRDGRPLLSLSELPGDARVRHLAMSRKPFLSDYRSGIMLVTVICILAVDFDVFPRSFAKTERQGTSLMDVGVGAFVFSSALVSRQARSFVSRRGPATAAAVASAVLASPLPLGSPTSGALAGVALEPASNLQSCGEILDRFITTISALWPLIVFGLARFFAHRAAEYQEHETEYGRHWNFYFTLGCVSIASVFTEVVIDQTCGCLTRARRSLAQRAARSQSFLLLSTGAAPHGAAAAAAAATAATTTTTASTASTANGTPSAPSSSHLSFFDSPALASRRRSRSVAEDSIADDSNPPAPSAVDDPPSLSSSSSSSSTTLSSSSSSSSSVAESAHASVPSGALHSIARLWSVVYHNRTIRASGYAVLGFTISGIYQFFLTGRGLREYIFDASRDDGLLSANREGFFGVIGFFAIYLCGVGVGRSLNWPRHTYRHWWVLWTTLGAMNILTWAAAVACDRFIDPVSRRTTNMSYVLWVVAFNISQVLVTLTIDLVVVSTDDEVPEAEHAPTTLSASPLLIPPPVPSEHEPASFSLRGNHPKDDTAELPASSALPSSSSSSAFTALASFPSATPSTSTSTSLNGNEPTSPLSSSPSPPTGRANGRRGRPLERSTDEVDRSSPTSSASASSAPMTASSSSATIASRRHNHGLTNGSRPAIRLELEPSNLSTTRLRSHSPALRLSTFARDDGPLLSDEGTSFAAGFANHTTPSGSPIELPPVPPASAPSGSEDRARSVADAAGSVIMDALNNNGLVLFIIANLLTGAVNVLVDSSVANEMGTFSLSNGAALAILFSYTGLVCAIGVLFRFFHISVKFW